MSWTVPFIDTPTGLAGARGVPGIDQEHRHTGQSRFVFDKGSQLEERPTVLDAPGFLEAISVNNKAPGAIIDVRPLLGIEDWYNA